MMCVRSRAWQEWRHNGSYVVIKRLVFKLRLFLNLRFKKSISNTLQGDHFVCDLEHKYKTLFNFKLRCQWIICGQNREKLVTATERVVDQNGFMSRSMDLQVFINISRFPNHFQQNSNVNKSQMVAYTRVRIIKFWYIFVEFSPIFCSQEEKVGKPLQK